MSVLFLFLFSFLRLAIGYPFECTLPKDVGPCRAFFRRFYFNMQTRKCEQFIYGGCVGNPNNFEHISQCQQECEKYGAVKGKINLVGSNKNIVNGFTLFDTEIYIIGILTGLIGLSIIFGIIYCFCYKNKYNKITNYDSDV